MESQSCKPVPTLSLDGYDTVRTNQSTCSIDETSRKLFESVQDKVVLVETGMKPSPRADADSKVGSGFFVGDGTQVVTNAHVAASGLFVDVVMNDGSRHHAQIAKLDDVNDLALLQVLDLEKDRKRAVDTKPADMKAGDTVLAFGHPDGYRDVVLSKGQYLRSDQMVKQIGDPNQYPDLLPIIELTNSKDPVIAAEANAYLTSERHQTRINIHHGNSGSVAFDADSGQLAGVVADKVGAKALIIPAEKADALVNGTEKKFDFEYQVAEGGAPRLESAKRTDGRAGQPIALDSAIPTVVS